MKLALSSPWIQSPFLPCFTQFGWHEDNSTVAITWDSESQEVGSEDSDSEGNSDTNSEASDSNYSD